MKHLTVHTHTGTLQEAAQVGALPELRNYTSLVATLRHTVRFLWRKGAGSDIKASTGIPSPAKVKIGLAFDPFREAMRAAFWPQS